MEPSADEVFAAMNAAVAATPKLKSKFNASVKFQLADDKDKSLTLHLCDSPKDKPDVIVTTSLETFHQILNKKLNPQQAFMKGKLKIKGTMSLAMKVTMIVNATRKQLTQKTPKSKL
eukprot:Nitzschia sp. Nitz4//scaffold223_size33660//2028//2378//NITZ4_007870-RA/size33660-processed-gene-0.14-mRNA-1//-1//CDS//3329542616//4541//frame0